VASGKELPSYITGAPVTTTAQAPAPGKPAAQPATEVAASTDKPVTWGESKWATPGGKDPAAVAATKPQVTTPAVSETVTEVAALPSQPELVAPVPMPASMRPKSRPVVQQPQVIDPQTVASFNGNNDRVTARDLRDWESGPLSDFLASRQQTRQLPPPSQPQAYQRRYDPRADGDYIEYDASPEYLGPVDNSGSFFIWN